MLKNILKRIPLILLCYLLGFTLTACGDEENEREKFLSFLGQEKNTVISKSQIDMCIISLNKEDSFQPKVVLEITPNGKGYSKIYDWLCLSATEKKKI